MHTMHSYSSSNTRTAACCLLPHVNFIHRSMHLRARSQVAHVLEYIGTNERTTATIRISKPFPAFGDLLISPATAPSFWLVALFTRSNVAFCKINCRLKSIFDASGAGWRCRGQDFPSRGGRLLRWRIQFHESRQRRRPVALAE